MRSMVRASAVAVSLVASLLSGAAFASDWKIDPEHSQVGFAVRHMMVSKVHGKFTKFTGRVMLDDADITKSKVEVDIDAASIDTSNAKRDEHLRSADFFDVTKFPKITFKSSKVEKHGGGIAVTGDLVIKGISKTVQLMVPSIAAEVKDPWGGIHRGTEEVELKINRKEFNLLWNKALDKGGVALGEEVTIELEVELIKEIPAAPNPPAKK